MIAIDTNVLLRYLLQDDKKQSAKADQLISGTEKVLLTDVVLAETVWTLKGKKYRLNKEDLLIVIDSLFKEPNISFEDGQTVWRAYHRYRSAQPVKVGKKKKIADFPDALILEKAKYNAVEKHESFSGFYSFDLALQQFDEIKQP